MDQIEALKLSEIKSDPNNPRGDSDITELVTSIKAHGILQPIIVRKVGKGYTIIAGERRFRAAIKIAREGDVVKKTVIPAIVRTVDDDTAFEIQMIENLQREGLPPYGEAYAYKLYIDRFGMEGAEMLADKIGCKPAYIRSRAAVFELPEKMLKAWEKGTISFGHLNAMLLVKDDEEMLKRLLSDAEDGASAKEILSIIQQRSTEISAAVFDTTECGPCDHNSDKQKTLFGIGHEKAYCAKPECFIGKTVVALSAAFADPKNKLHKKCGTNGYLLALEYDDTKNMHLFQSWDKKSGPFEECKPCDKFITIFALNGKNGLPKACGNKECHKRLCRAASGEDRKKARKDVSDGKIGEEKKRCAWHGKLYREKFYMDRIPVRAAEIKPDSVESLHAAILALVIAHGLYQELADLTGSKKSGSEMTNGLEIVNALSGVDFENSLQILRDLSVHTVMDWNDSKPGFGTTTRDAVAKLFGVDIASEWKPTEEYLLAKSKKEIFAWFETFPEKDKKIIIDLAMKRGSGPLINMKKNDLVKTIMGAGVDLTGQVPDEIVNYDKLASVPYNKKPGNSAFADMDVPTDEE